jgi:effector-binding domain-containing protein
MFDVRTREVPELLVITERGNVTQAELVEWLPGAMARVARAAERFGGVADSSQLWLLRGGRPAEPVILVIYEGNPNDGQVPVEVCAPVRLDHEEATEVAIHRVPAHREAYVRLTKDQTVPLSKVGSAYAAVEAWVSSRGFEVVDAPREVYYTDYHAAAPTDEVFDVAFPIGPDS